MHSFFLSLIRILFVFFFLGGIFGANAENPPEWVNTLPIHELKIYAVGVAKIDNDYANGVADAERQAKMELLMSLRVSINSKLGVTNYREERDGYTESHRKINEKVDIVSQIKNMPAIKITEIFSDTQSNTVYALPELDIDVAEKEILLRQNRLAKSIDLVSQEKNIQLNTLLVMQGIKKELEELEDLTNILQQKIVNDVSKSTENIIFEYRKNLQNIKKSVKFCIKTDDTDFRLSVINVLTLLDYYHDECLLGSYVVSIVGSNLEETQIYGLYVIKRNIVVQIISPDNLVLKSELVVVKGGGGGLSQANYQLRKQSDKKISEVLLSWFEK